VRRAVVATMTRGTALLRAPWAAGPLGIVFMYGCSDQQTLMLANLAGEV
jgi:hypothetical protein